MVAVPTNHTWTNGEKPDFRALNLYLSDMATFLLNPPMIRLRKTTTQTYLNNTDTPIQWNFVEVETHNMWDATQPTRITPSVPGWYIGSAGISFTGNATGYRQMDIRKNNSGTDRILRIRGDANIDVGLGHVIRGNVFLEQFNGTTDYIEVIGFQNSGVTMSAYLASFETIPEISLRWFGAL